MFSLKYVTLIYLVVPTRYSLLLNSHNLNGIRMSDYCPKMPHCEEGTHVLCMYYDPVRIMGPACSQDARNVTATEKFKSELLDVLNEMRRRVAKGEEIGLNDEPLPKAYGMRKLDWDDELASFAQIWANQCTLRHDLCRATRRFPDPGQLTSIFRFSFPDWQVLKGENKSSEKFLTDDKVILAMRKSLKNAYKLKKFLTKEMIYSFPDFKKKPELESSKIYLTVVDGKSTHVGCGISAFSDYYGQVRDEEVIHNVVEIVCNFAAQPIVGQKVYETERPIGPNFSPTYGCPPGFLEDTKDGFCIDPNSRYGMVANYRKAGQSNWCKNNGNDEQCSATVDLVPLFKMEDAPKNKQYKYQSTAPPNVTVRRRSNSLINNELYGLNQAPPNALKPSNKYTRLNSNEVKKRYFNRNVVPIYPEQNARRSNSYVGATRRLGARTQMPPTSKRDSIFTRVSKFKLPDQSKHQHKPINNYWINSTRNINIKQVKPRKDFSQAKDLVSAYLEKKKHKKGFSTPYHHNQMNTLVHSNYNLERNHSTIPNARTLFPEANDENLLALTITKTGNPKLLHLLESLEREIQNTELNRDLKEMVNAKIRKFYGNVLSDNAIQLKSDRSDILDKVISKLEKKTGSNIMEYRDRKLHWNREDGYKFEPTSTPKYDIPLKRNQNAISLYDRPNYKPLKSRFSPITDINHIYDSFLAISKNMYAKKDNYKRPNTGYIGKNSYDMHNDHEISGLDKLKYLQEKQEDLEKKLQSLRNSKHRYELQRESSRKLRPVFIPRSEPEKPRSTTNLQNYYVPDRAKFLHHI